MRWGVGGDGLQALTRARLLVTLMFLGAACLQPDGDGGPLVVVGVVACGWVAVTALPDLWRPDRAWTRRALIVGDIAVLGSAGLLSPDATPYPFIALLVLCALPATLPWRSRLGFYGVFAVWVGGPVLGHELHSGGLPRGTLSFVLGLGVAWVISTRSSEMERRSSARIEAVRREGGGLLSDASELSEARRRELSHTLHDSVLQSLLAAGQDLEEGAQLGENADVARARALLGSAVASLRGAVTELHPVSLAGARLPDALGALIQYHRDQGAQITSTIAEDAHGLHDDALFATAREIIADSVARARGRMFYVRVRREEGHVVVEVDSPDLPGGEDAGQAAGGIVAIALAAARLREVGGALELQHGTAHPSRAVAPLT